jgi:hypothetical protein
MASCSDNDSDCDKDDNGNDKDNNGNAVFTISMQEASTGLTGTYK